MRGCWLPSVGAAAAAGRCILAHAVGGPDGATSPRIPAESIVGLARLGVASDAVDAASSVPTSECADCEAGTAVSAGAWELERNRACHSFHLVFNLLPV